jgi:hypothetical protein
VGFVCAVEPSGGFGLTRDVKPLLALKPQTLDYVSEPDT